MSVRSFYQQPQPEWEPSSSNVYREEKGEYLLLKQVPLKGMLYDIRIERKSAEGKSLLDPSGNLIVPDIREIERICVETLFSNVNPGKYYFEYQENPEKCFAKGKNITEVDREFASPHTFFNGAKKINELLSKPISKQRLIWAPEPGLMFPPTQFSSPAHSPSPFSASPDLETTSIGATASSDSEGVPTPVRSPVSYPIPTQVSSVPAPLPTVTPLPSFNGVPIVTSPSLQPPIYLSSQQGPPVYSSRREEQPGLHSPASQSDDENGEAADLGSPGFDLSRLRDLNASPVHEGSRSELASDVSRPLSDQHFDLSRLRDLNTFPVHEGSRSELRASDVSRSLSDQPVLPSPQPQVLNDFKSHAKRITEIYKNDLVNERFIDLNSIPACIADCNLDHIQFSGPEDDKIKDWLKFLYTQMSRYEYKDLMNKHHRTPPGIEFEEWFKHCLARSLTMGIHPYSEELYHELKALRVGPAGNILPDS